MGKAYLWNDRAIFLPLLLTAVAAFVFSGCIAWRTVQADALRTAIEQRHALMLLATELRHSSDALTRWSRAYVVTGEPGYRVLYTELVEVRNGLRGRPSGLAPTYWNLREFAGAPRDESQPARTLARLLAEAGANPEELEFLEAARVASEQLAALERAIMAERQHAPPEHIPSLVKQLFDANYIGEKSRVMTPIEELTAHVLMRTQSKKDALSQTILEADILIGIALVLMFAGLGLTWFGFRRITGDSFATLVERIRALAPGTNGHAGPAGEAVSLASLLQGISRELDLRSSSIRKLIEDLRTERLHLQQLIAQAPVALALFDRDMRYVAFSDRWVQDYGLQGRELIGHSHYEIFPEIPERWRDIHRRGLSGENLSAFEDRFERADGRVQYLRWEVAPWFGTAGSVDGLVILTEDVTDAVTQRAELDAWVRTYEQSKVGAGIIDPADPGPPRLVDVNPQLARLLGYSRQALCGRAVMSIVPESLQAPMRAKLPELEATGHISFESELIAGDGRRIPVLLDITNQPVRPGEPRRRTVFVIELSERNKLLSELSRHAEELRASNRRLHEARDEAIAASRTKSAILANMSHELRTPLNHVLGFATLLDHPGLGQKAQERVQRILAAGGTLLRLVNNLLDAVKLETEALSVAPRDFELAAMLGELAQGTAADRERRQVELAVAIADDLPARIHGDPRRIAQALRELLDNAAKFSTSGSRIALRASRELPQSGGTRLRLEVVDHGIGISPGQQSQLFGWFRQGDDSFTRRYGGVGIGLVLAQRVSSLLGGEIGYHPTDGGGSTFWIALPLEAAREPESALEAPAADPVAARAWLLPWLQKLRAADIEAASAWRSRPASVDVLLGERGMLVGTAVANFDFDIAAELVADALGPAKDVESASA